MGSNFADSCFKELGVNGLKGFKAEFDKVQKNMSNDDMEKLLKLLVDNIRTDALEYLYTKRGMEKTINLYAYANYTELPENPNQAQEYMHNYAVMEAVDRCLNSIDSIAKGIDADKEVKIRDGIDALEQNIQKLKLVEPDIKYTVDEQIAQAKESHKNYKQEKSEDHKKILKQEFLIGGAKVVMGFLKPLNFALKKTIGKRIKIDTTKRTEKIKELENWTKRFGIERIGNTKILNTNKALAAQTQRFNQKLRARTAQVDRTLESKSTSNNNKTRFGKIASDASKKASSFVEQVKPSSTSVSTQIKK